MHPGALKGSNCVSLIGAHPNRERRGARTRVVPLDHVKVLG